MRELIRDRVIRNDAERTAILTDAYKKYDNIVPIIKRPLGLLELCKRMSVFVMDFELIVGGKGPHFFSSPQYPEWGASEWIIEMIESGQWTLREDGLYHNPDGEEVRHTISPEDYQIIRDAREFWETRKVGTTADAWQPDHYEELARLNVSSYVDGGMGLAALPAGHLIAGYEKVINVGYAAIRKQAQDWIDAHYGNLMGEDMNRYMFYKSVVITCDAAMTLVRRYSEACAQKAAAEKDPKRKAELEMMADGLLNLSENPARSFWEAVQGIMMYQVLLQIECKFPSPALGRFDQYTWPFLKKDLDEGRITTDYAQEIVDAFFLKALRWFDARKIDALAISGDLTDQQMILEIEHFMSCYQSVFKDGKRSDGGPVTPVFVTGNHDDEGYVYIAGRCNGLRGEAISKVAGNTKWSLERMQNDVSNSVAKATRAIELNVPVEQAAPVLAEIRALGHQAAATTNAAGLAALAGAFGTVQSNAVALLTDNAFLCNVNITSVWKRVLGEDYSQFFHKRVKGYDFVGANWNGIGWGGEAFNLKGYLASLDLARDRPFFYIQHPHPRDTCHGNWVWGQDNGSSTAVLAKYPNVIALSGHSHTPVADERAIWQGAFTSIGCGSLYYPGSIKGREQARDDNRKVGRDGLLFSVYEDRVVVERRDFLNDAEIEPKWVFPAPTFGGGEARPYTPAVRRQTEPIPEFAKDAAVGVAVLHVL